MNQKWFANKLVVGIVIALIMIVGYGLWLNSLPCGDPRSPFSPYVNCAIINNEIADWRTHEVYGLGFEIKLPPGWIMEPSASGLVFYLQSPENFANREYLPHEYSDVFTANIIITYDYEDIAQRAKKEGKILKPETLEEYIRLNSKNDLSKVQKISFAGELAFRGLGLGMSGNDAIWVQKDNHLYKIEITDDYGMDDQLSAKILSTFKFTK